MPAVSRLGDTSDHGGTITTVYSVKTTVNGIKVARIGDLHTCPIKGHGVTAILTGSSSFLCEGANTAIVGSKCGCGAIINSGSSDTFAPL